MRRFIIFTLVVFSLNSCFLNKNKNETEEQDLQIPEKTEEQLAAERIAREDSIKNAEFELLQKTAFGDLMFGMGRDKINGLNKNRQQLGRQYYNFNYAFNGQDQLYLLNIKSDSEKVIAYDDGLKSKYNNLFQIIKTKYGEPSLKKEYPSIFEVEEAGTYWINKWEVGRKEILLGLSEISLNDLQVLCQISDQDMVKQEQERLYKINNKDILDAAEKF